MKRLFFALLLACMSANADRLSDVEWNDLYRKCANDKIQSACQTLIRNGLPNIKACDKDSCLQVGVIYWQIGAFQKGLSFCTRACELDNTSGCWRLANIFENGLENIPKNLTTAIKYRVKTCKLGDGILSQLSCQTLADNYYKGTNGYAQNFAKAKEYYELACNGGDMNGCFALGTLHYKGQGTPKDFFKAFELFETACEKTDKGLAKGKACEKLASLYKNGEGIKQNLPLAKKYFGLACDLKVQAGCASYKKLNEQGVADIQEESNFWDKWF